MVVMVVQVMVPLLMLLLMMMEMVAVVVTQVRLHRVPGTDDLRLGSVRQDVQDAERFHTPFVRVPVPLVLVVRLLHLHHLQPFQGFEVIVRGTSRRGTVAAGPAVHLLVVLFVLLILPQRCHGITTATLVGTQAPAVGHPVVAAPRVAVLVVDHGVPGVAPPRTQPLRVLLPRLGEPLVLLATRGDHHEGQRTRAADGYLVLVVLNVTSARGASARCPSVSWRAQAARRRGTGRHRRRRRHRVRFCHFRGAHS